VVVYLFGSALTSSSPGDVDVLIVYDESCADAAVAYSADVAAVFDGPFADITILSAAEDDHSQFSRLVRPVS
jgi:predicted nucleotidyltransferase